MDDLQSQLERLGSGGAITSRVISSRSKVEQELRAYGEDAVAAKLGFISEEDFTRLSERAFAYACLPSGKKSDGGMLIAKALALAAVEIVEGAPRELHRKRRAYT